MSVPILYTGTIKPPPVSTTLVSNDSTGGIQGWVPIYGCGAISLYPTNQGFGMRADFRGCPPGNMSNFLHAHPTAGIHNWSLADGQTLECQADLVRISENTTNIAYLLVGGDAGLYWLGLGQKGAGLYKWTPAIHPDVVCFWWDNTVQVPRTNVVLYLAVTRSQASAIITTRVLDKANQNAVLFEKAFTDTPGVDGSLANA